MLSRSVCQGRVGFGKSYVCQGHLPLINYERMQHLRSTRRKAGEERSSGVRAPSDLMAREATGACDSLSLETAGLWSLGSPLVLEQKFFFHSLGERSSWQTGIDNDISQLMECSIQHWPICGTNVSFRTYLHCLLVTAFHIAPSGTETGLCWLVMKFRNCLCVLSKLHFSYIYRRFSIQIN